ncbi:hypothetical protein N7362_12085 [Aeromonas caviae]|uniref:hypothetical protein n=1 Tax=Aeromonas caviae TaxID=648 RepID=UPI00244A1B7F|nr:hypothetical protein [Aeromonas caviae]MDH0475520.1 hypothetical protein [Aeromonas caviae]
MIVRLEPITAIVVAVLPPGMVTRPTGTVQIVDGIELEVREAVPGYHANVITQDPALASALAALTVTVETPQYVWEG